MSLNALEERLQGWFRAPWTIYHKPFRRSIYSVKVVCSFSEVVQKFSASRLPVRSLFASRKSYCYVLSAFFHILKRVSLRRRDRVGGLIYPKSEERELHFQELFLKYKLFYRGFIEVKFTAFTKWKRQGITALPALKRFSVENAPFSAVFCLFFAVFCL